MKIFCLFARQHHRLEHLAEHFGVHRDLLIQRCRFRHRKIVTAQQTFFAQNIFKQNIVEGHRIARVPFIRRVKQAAVEKWHHAQFGAHAFRRARVLCRRTIQRIEK